MGWPLGPWRRPGVAASAGTGLDRGGRPLRGRIPGGRARGCCGAAERQSAGEFRRRVRGVGAMVPLGLMPGGPGAQKGLACLTRGGGKGDRKTNGGGLANPREFGVGMVGDAPWGDPLEGR